jgi:hypothetical protein
MSLILSGTDGLSDVDGTAATPAIRGTDANTGIFFGTDIIGFSEGGVEAARINSSGQFDLVNNPVLTGGTANGVAYLNGSKVLTTGSALTFSGSALAVTGTASATTFYPTVTSGTGIQMTSTGNNNGNWTIANNYGQMTIATEGTAGSLVTGSSQGAALFGNSSNVPAQFFTNNTVRATIDTSGNLLVGTTSAPTGGAVSTWQNAGSSRWSMGPNGGSAFVVFNTSNVGCYVVDGQTGWTGTSDGTLKNVIAPITNGLSSIIGLKPTIYSWKSDEANTPYAGLIAQEVQSLLPDLVNDNNGTLGVNYTGVIPYLISAIQEQQALITTLTARITALESA